MLIGGDGKCLLRLYQKSWLHRHGYPPLAFRPEGNSQPWHPGWRDDFNAVNNYHLGMIFTYHIFPICGDFKILQVVLGGLSWQNMTKPTRKLFVMSCIYSIWSRLQRTPAVRPLHAPNFSLRQQQTFGTAPRLPRLSCQDTCDETGACWGSSM
jgi:hypothetical protein